MDIKKEAAVRRYNDNIERIKAAYSQADKYPNDKRQRRFSELAESTKRIEADYKDNLDKITEDINKIHDDYRKNIAKIKAKVDEINRER